MCSGNLIYISDSKIFSAIGRKDFNPEIIVLKNEESENKTNEDVISEKENKKEKKASFATKDVTQSVSINSEKLPEDHEYLKEISEDDSSYDESRGSKAKF